jgi:hypothetical protein
MVMVVSAGEAGPATDPSFWAVRNSLLPATSDMERAANLLNAVAEIILADRNEEVVALIQQADIRDLFEVREQACRAPPVFSVHRLRKVANLSPKIPKEQRNSPFKPESPLGDVVFRRVAMPMASLNPCWRQQPKLCMKQQSCVATYA